MAAAERKIILKQNSQYILLRGEIRDTIVKVQKCVHRINNMSEDIEPRNIEDLPIAILANNVGQYLTNTARII